MAFLGKLFGKKNKQKDDQTVTEAVAEQTPAEETAPAPADDILFGEVWSRNDKLSLRDRSMVTVATLVAKGMGDTFACQYQMQEAKKNGVTKEEMAEILTHQAFYAGWPNVWAAFNSMKKAYVEEGAAK